MCVCLMRFCSGAISKGRRGVVLKKSRQCTGKVVLDAFRAMKAAQRAGGSG